MSVNNTELNTFNYNLTTISLNKMFTALVI